MVSNGICMTDRKSHQKCYLKNFLTNHREQWIEIHLFPHTVYRAEEKLIKGYTTVKELTAMGLGVLLNAKFTFIFSSFKTSLMYCREDQDTTFFLHKLSANSLKSGHHQAFLCENQSLTDALFMHKVNVSLST
uniref:Uncharacterized protein n=1 Tax=Anguilla anguilla TaxID=7936 RepID=A0A0E9XJ15_ANGAN